MIYKDTLDILLVEGFIKDDLVITNNHIWIFWEGKEVHYQSNAVNEHFYPGEHWFYRLKWRIPAYAPPGDYLARF